MHTSLTSASYEVDNEMCVAHSIDCWKAGIRFCIQFALALTIHLYHRAKVINSW